MTAPDLVLDLFAGPGGFDEGMRLLGIDNVIGIEWDAAACQTAEAAGHTRLQYDVSTLNPAVFGRPWGLAGSPPCTTFSMAGHGAGRLIMAVIHAALDDIAKGLNTRARRRREAARILAAWALANRPTWTRAERSAWARKQAVMAMQVVEPLRYIRELRPAWVALEQVPEVLPLWKHYTHILRTWGYGTWAGVLNSADYGVPQTRKRAVLMAKQGNLVGPPMATHAKDPGEPDLFGTELLPWVSMAEALGWTGAVINRDRGAGMLERHGQREARDMDEPAPTITAGTKGSGPRLSWVIDRRTNSSDGKGGSYPTPPVGADQPAPTFTGSNPFVFRQLVNGAQTNATARTADEPAATIYCSRPGNLRWTETRPATTVQGDPRIGRPGHKDRAGGEVQFEQESVRVTVAEAAVLQSFRADYPWRGTKSKQFEQVGNAIPVLLAAAVVGALTGRTAAVPVDYGAAA